MAVGKLIASVSDDFHIYACRWTPERIVWYIDGQLVNEAANTDWQIPQIPRLKPPCVK